MTIPGGTKICIMKETILSVIPFKSRGFKYHDKSSTYMWLFNGTYCTEYALWLTKMHRGSQTFHDNMNKFGVYYLLVRHILLIKWYDYQDILHYNLKRSIQVVYLLSEVSTHINDSRWYLSLLGDRGIIRQSIFGSEFIYLRHIIDISYHPPATNHIKSSLYLEQYFAHTGWCFR